MYMVCLMLTLLWGAWSRIGIGDYNHKAGIRGLVIGDGRGDDTVRVYAGSDEGNVYELSYNQGIWNKRLVGKLELDGSIHSLAIGPARNDGIKRIYATSEVRDSTSQIHEFTWDGNTWQELLIGPAENNTFSIKIGKGRNDDTLRIYAGTRHTPPVEGYCYELTYRDDEWDHVRMGGLVNPTYYHHDLWVGDGRGDDTIRVYTACSDGKVWEYTFREDRWDSRVIDHANAAWAICVAKGRNDGTNRVYVSCIPEGTTGAIYELTYENNLWTREVIGTTPTYLLGLGTGRGRNDDTIRIYAGTYKGYLYEFTWRNGKWEDFECGDIGTWFWMHDVVIATGRNDDTLRVYTGAGDGRIHEFTFHPEPKIRVYPDSSQATNPGIPVTYNLWVVNEGTHEDIVDMTTEGTHDDWEVRLIDSLGNPLQDSDGDNVPDVGKVQTPDSVAINAEITPPPSVALRTVDSTVVRGTSSHDLDVYDEALLVTKIAGIAVYPDQEGTADPGKAVTYPLIIANFTYSDHLVNLSVTKTSSGWSALLTDLFGTPLSDSDGDGRKDVGPLSPSQSTHILAFIQSPEGLEGGMIDSTIVTGESHVSPSIRDSAILLTTIRSVLDVEIAYDSFAWTPAGKPLRYRAEVRNLSNRSDAVDLVRNSKNTWSWTLYDATGVTELTDTDADSYQDVGELQAKKGSAVVWFEITPPEETPHNTVDTSYLVAFSSFDYSVRDSIRLLTRVTNPVPGVWVEPDTSGFATAGEDNFYLMRVINMGDATDNFLLETSSDLGWDAKILNQEGGVLTSTGNIAPGETLFVELHITPPAELASLKGTSHAEMPSERRLLVAISTTEKTVKDSAVIITQAVPPLDIHNYPNPFKGSTIFIYSIPAQGKATLAIYNRAGEHVTTLFEDRLHTPGIYTVPWDGLSTSGQKPAPGVYIYTLQFKPKEGRPRKVVKSALLQP